MKNLLALVTFALFSHNAISEWIEDVNVVDVRWYASGHGYISIDDKSNPGCPEETPDSGHLYFKKLDVDSYQNFISLGLSAMLSNKLVTVQVTGCNDSNQYSKLTGIILKSE